MKKISLYRLVQFWNPVHECSGRFCALHKESFAKSVRYTCTPFILHTWRPVLWKRASYYCVFKDFQDPLQIILFRTLGYSFYGRVPSPYARSKVFEIHVYTMHTGIIVSSLFIKIFEIPNAQVKSFH